MNIEEFSDYSKKRFFVANQYLFLLKEKMGDHLVCAYIYGSTVKNCARQDSDVDLILVVKKPTPEEKIFMNSREGGLFDRDRQGTMNFAFNSHYVFKFIRELKEMYGIDISPYYHYEEEGQHQRIRQTPFTLTSVLASPYAVWPNDFEDITLNM